MRESEQFDDLTTTDEDMPSPETTSMTLEDYFAGEDPEFKPILPENDGVGQLLHDNIENDLGDVGIFLVLWKRIGLEWMTGRTLALIVEAKK